MKIMKAPMKIKKITMEIFKLTKLRKYAIGEKKMKFTLTKIK